MLHQTCLLYGLSPEASTSAALLHDVKPQSATLPEADEAWNTTSPEADEADEARSTTIPEADKVLYSAAISSWRHGVGILEELRDGVLEASADSSPDTSTC